MKDAGAVCSSERHPADVQLKLLCSIPSEGLSSGLQTISDAIYSWPLDQPAQILFYFLLTVDMCSVMGLR